MALRLDTAEPPDAGIVHENVEPALPPRRLVDHRLPRRADRARRQRTVRTRAPLRRDACQLGLRFLQVILIDAADRDVDALLQNAAATARPMPRDPPVTIATLPSRDAWRNYMTAAKGRASMAVRLGTLPCSKIAGPRFHSGAAIPHAHVEAMPAARPDALRANS